MAGEPNRRPMGETGAVPGWSALITSVVTVGVLALLLRWAYGGKRRSLVERRPRPGTADDYGLMVSVASPGSFIEGELSRQRLAAAGIKAQLVTTTEGPRLMVLHEDEVPARRLLATP
jgi:hypothetical protein